MTGSASHRHERAVAVEQASYRWAYFAMSFGVLGLVAYRSLLWREASWDLLLLVVLGGTVPAAYQAYHHVAMSRSAVRILAAAGVAAMIAAVLVWIS